MRYIVYGAGAIGGVLGGRLFAAGKDTVLICRGRHLAAIRDQGLLLREPAGDRRLGVPAVGHPRELQFAAEDVVILTMKSQDTSGALDDLEEAGGGDVPIVCCQNGVDNERLAARRFARVYGMLVSLPADFMEPGIVLGWGSPTAGVLDLGGFPEGVDGLARQIAADIGDAGFVARPDPAIMRLKYTKLITNLGNGYQALTYTERDDHSDGNDETGRRVLRRMREEAQACFAAAGIAYASQDEYREHVGQHFQRADIAGAQRGGSSTWQSLVKGSTRLETDYLNGEIVLLGRLHGVPTPYNAAVRLLSQQLAAQGGRPGTYVPTDIEALAERLAAGAVV